MAATQYETDSEVGVTTLISGIVQDARELFMEQTALFKVEVKNDIRRTTAALIPLGLGVAVLLVGLILMGIAAANFLVWFFPALPMWLAYVITGMVALVAGGLLVMNAKSMLDKVSLTPDTSLRGLKENLQWKTKT